MLSQQSFDRRESFQDVGYYGPDHENPPFHQQINAAFGETSPEAIAPQTFDDAVSAGFRIGHREHATATAEKTLAAGASATQTILQMASWIQEMKAQLNRKEFGAFVKGLLQWVGDEARKYLDIARAFKDFDLSRLLPLEPFTLLKLRSKRYAPVVAALREQPVITPKVVQNLIREVLPKQPSKKKSSDISGWKRNLSGGGRHYEVLLHDETTGLSIEQQAQAEGILPQTVIAEAVALRAKHKESSGTQVIESIANTSSQTGDIQEQSQAHIKEVDELTPSALAWIEGQPVKEALAIPLASESVDEAATQEHSVDQHLEQQPKVIAVPPEALLAGENRTEVEWVLNAPIDEVEQMIGSVPVRSAYRALYLLNRFESSEQERMELLEQHVTEYHIAIGAVKSTAAITTEQVTKYSSQETEVTDSLETEQESSRSDPASGDNDLPEKEARMWKSWAFELGLVLDYITIGEYTVRHKYRKLGTVVQKYDSNNNSWWENRRQVSLLGVDDGDLMRYKIPEEAAIALGKLCEVIAQGSSTSAELCGGWESEPSHLVKEHTDLIDDVEQEVQSLQAVGGEGEAP